MSKQTNLFSRAEIEKEILEQRRQQKRGKPLAGETADTLALLLAEMQIPE